MRTIITGDLAMMLPPPQRVSVRVGGSRRTFSTRGADVTTTKYRNLDEELAGLVQWCLASSSDRPSIERLHAAAKSLGDKATPSRYSRYPKGKFETDSEIRRIIQSLILDAP